MTGMKTITVINRLMRAMMISPMMAEMICPTSPTGNQMPLIISPVSPLTRLTASPGELGSARAPGCCKICQNTFFRSSVPRMNSMNTLLYCRMKLTIRSSAPSPNISASSAHSLSMAGASPESVSRKVCRISPVPSGTAKPTIQNAALPSSKPGR
jgi:hypothetical protein